MHRRRGYRQLVEGDLDIMPLMNLFVVLIPMLLLSAVFVEINAIEMDLPPSGDTEQSREQESLDLAIRLEPQRYVVEGRNLKSRSVERRGPEAQAELRALLTSIRTANPTERSVRIESPSATRYQDLVSVMDVARSTGLDAIALARRSTAGSLREAR